LGVADARGGAPRGVRLSAKLKHTWAYEPASGRPQVLRYLAGTNPDSRRKMNALIAHVDEYGFHPSKTRYRPVGGALVEFKVKNPRAIRVLSYRLPEGGHVLLLGFDKVDGPIPKDVMKRAREMAREFVDGGMRLD
jgi:hypothetical protein